MVNCAICGKIIFNETFKCRGCGLIVCRKHFYNGKCFYCNNEYYNESVDYSKIVGWLN